MIIEMAFDREEPLVVKKTKAPRTIYRHVAGDPEPVRKYTILPGTGARFPGRTPYEWDSSLAAHEDPSLYPDLIVRVTGFSAYFNRLTPEFRQLVINRLISEG